MGRKVRLFQLLDVALQNISRKMDVPVRHCSRAGERVCTLVLRDERLHLVTRSEVAVSEDAGWQLAHHVQLGSSARAANCPAVGLRFTFWLWVQSPPSVRTLNGPGERLQHERSRNPPWPAGHQVIVCDPDSVHSVPRLCPGRQPT